VVGDDVAILDEEGATSFPRPLRLRRPTIDLLDLDDVAAQSLWDTADEVYRVAPSTLADQADLPMPPRPVTDVLLLSRERAGVAPAPTAESLPTLLRHRFETALDAASTLAQLTSLVADARVWSVGVDRPPVALAHAILKEITT
jgi:hypothetical protein